jgi:hypothetical protein
MAPYGLVTLWEHGYEELLRDGTRRGPQPARMRRAMRRPPVASSKTLMTVLAALMALLLIIAI